MTTTWIVMELATLADVNVRTRYDHYLGPLLLRPVDNNGNRSIDSAEPALLLETAAPGR